MSYNSDELLKLAGANTSGAHCCQVAFGHITSGFSCPCGVRWYQSVLDRAIRGICAFVVDEPFNELVPLLIPDRRCMRLLLLRETGVLNSRQPCCDVLNADGALTL